MVGHLMRAGIKLLCKWLKFILKEEWRIWKLHVHLYLTVFVLMIMRNDLVVINVGSKRLRWYIFSLGLIIMVKKIYSMHVGAVLKVWRIFEDSWYFDCKRGGGSWAWSKVLQGLILMRVKCGPKEVRMQNGVAAKD